MKKMKPGPTSREEGVSVTLSLTDHRAISPILSTIDPATASARVSIRGAASQVVDLLGRLGDRAVDVSAVVTVRGDKPPRR